MQTQTGYTALMLAAIAGHSDIVKLLLAAEACLITRQDTLDFPAGTTALLMAATAHHDACVDVLVQQEAKASSWSPLHYSALKRDYQAVLCQQSIQSFVDRLGRTPLFYAALGRYSEAQLLTIKALDRLSPRVEPDVFGLFPVHYAAAWNNVSASYYFLQKRVYV